MDPHECPCCPDASRWRALLEDRLTPEEQAGLSAHLESCASCRDHFDALTAESGVWDQAKQLADGPETLPHLPRHDAGSPHSAARSHPDRHPAGLPFLEPLDQENRIGQFAHYEVIEVVGRGGMGVVLKAFDPALHRVVAVKVLAPQLAAGMAARRRFVREARAAASVAHEHVVTIHAVDEFEGWPYLVMQYVGGKSLQDRIDRGGPLDVREILRISMQTAQGLAAAHAQGLVHRDIKPANILLENGVERVKLTDFGLARAVDDPSLTQAGVVAGTPQYMSPEQAHGETVDARSDLFSLGCVMYAMATGRSPFRADSTMAVLRKVCEENPRPIRASNPDIPPWLDAVILKLLAKDPDFRFTSAAEVADVLADYLSRLQQGQPILEHDLDLDGDVSDELDVGPAKLQPLALAPHAAFSAPHGSARPRGWHAAAAAGLLALLGLGATEAMGVTRISEMVATVLRIKVPEGTLVLEIADPDTKVSIDGGDLVITGGGVREVRLKAGSHQLQALRGDSLAGPVELVEIRKGDKHTVRVGFEPQGGVVHFNGHPISVPKLAQLRAAYEHAGALRARAFQLKHLADQLGQTESSRSSPPSDPERELHTAKALADQLQTMYDQGLIPRSQLIKALSQYRALEAARNLADVSKSIAQARRSAAESLERAAEVERRSLETQIVGIESGEHPEPASEARRASDEAQALAHKALVDYVSLQLEADRLRLAAEQRGLADAKLELELKQKQADAGLIQLSELDDARKCVESLDELTRALQASLEEKSLHLDSIKRLGQREGCNLELLLQAFQGADTLGGKSGHWQHPGQNTQILVTSRSELKLNDELKAQLGSVHRLLERVRVRKGPGHASADFRSHEKLEAELRALEMELNDLPDVSASAVMVKVPQPPAAGLPPVPLPPAIPGEGIVVIPPTVPLVADSSELEAKTRKIHARIEQLEAELEALEGIAEDIPPVAPTPTQRTREQYDPHRADPADSRPGNNFAWHYTNVDPLKLTEVAGKPRLVYFVDSDCDKCELMETTVLTDRAVGERICNLIRIRLETDFDPDDDRDETAPRPITNHGLLKRLAAGSSPPLFVILDDQGNVVAKQGFTTSPADFIRFVDSANIESNCTQSGPPSSSFP